MKLYTILMRRLMILFTLCSIYSLQVLLQVISLSHPSQCLKFRILQNVVRNVLFFFTNLSQSNFLYYPKFFIWTKVLRTARAPTELKQNLLHRPFFCQFFQVTEHQARWVQSFSQSFKISFLNCDRKEAKLYQCFSPGGS